MGINASAWHIHSQLRYFQIAGKACVDNTISRQKRSKEAKIRLGPDMQRGNVTTASRQLCSDYDVQVYTVSDRRREKGGEIWGHCYQRAGRTSRQGGQEQRCLSICSPSRIPQIFHARPSPPLSRAEGIRTGAPALWRGAAVLEIPGVWCSLAGSNIGKGTSCGLLYWLHGGRMWKKYDAYLDVARQRLR